MGRLITSLRRLGRQLRAWVDARPRLAWWSAFALVMGLAAWESAYWPLNDFPGATWHHDDPGIDVTACRAGAAAAGWPELAGFWRGPYIDGNPTFRPLSAWLFVAEYRLFGADDRLWCWVSIGLHLVATAAAFWAAGRLLGGSPTRRLAVGAGTALLAAGPGLADRHVHGWVLAWWPSQPDPLSLTCAWVLLAATAEHVRAAEAKAAAAARRWGALAVGAFLLGLCFKEMMYVAGLGACLLCARRRSVWPLLAALAAIGLAAFAYRSSLYGGRGGHSSDDLARLGRAVAGSWLALRSQAVAALPHVVLLGLGAALARGLARWRRAPFEGAVLGGVLWLVVGTALLGPPWESLFRDSAFGLLSLLAGAAMLWLLARAARVWPVPELLLLTLLVVAMGWSFPPVLAWHRYWAEAFMALTVVTALAQAAAQLAADPPGGAGATPIADA
jgi:hypothetical protein